MITQLQGELSEIEKTALIALAHACKWSLNAHVSEERIGGVPSNLRGAVRKSLKKLHSRGYCRKHPTGGSTTWNLTPMGLETARTLQGIFR